jgi:C_GCAxxG_C_C family probable redox protein
LKNVEQTVAKFENGLLCSQSILSTFGPRYGLDERLALRLAAGFGGGMGRTAQTCGAVIGSILVIGLNKGGIALGETASRDDAYQTVKEFLNRFQAMHGSTICRELLECDISKPDGYEQAKAGDLFKIKCPKFVGSAAEILEKLLSA